MSEEYPDLEAIDLSAPPSGAVAAPPGWAPGWYADPWTAGQYRYWSGQAWTGETSRWGPSTANPATSGDATEPWPASPSPMAGAYGLPFPPASDPTSAYATRRTQRRGPVVIGVAALLVVLLVSGAIGYAINSSSQSKSSVQVEPPTSTTPGTTPSTGAPSLDPDRRALTGLVVRENDVAASRTVALIPGGNLLSQPTLDLCNGTYSSEALRTARLQVAEIDARETTSLSTEAVLYRDADASAQAFAELRRVSAACPKTPVASPVGEGTATTVFQAPPDGDWPSTPTVERQAYSIVTTQNDQSSASIAVYLRRGRALLGLYFPHPNGAQPPVAGQTSIEGIVGVFEARMAKLPKAVVDARR